MHTFSMHTVRRKKTERTKMFVRRKQNESVTKGVRKFTSLKRRFRSFERTKTHSSSNDGDISSAPDECVEIVPTWLPTWLENYSHRREGGT